MSSRAVFILSLLVVIAAAPSVAAQDDEDRPPAVHQIRSVLNAPFNYYEVDAIDPEVKALTFTWSISGNGLCGPFTQTGATASWRHDDEDRCPHAAAAHPGTITVVVSDGTHEVTRSYDGGSAPFEPGQPPWVTGEGIGGFTGGNETGDDPRDVKPPAIYGEEFDCPAQDAAGAFEPVQAVWQDEDTALFPEEPGRRLVRVSPQALKAELDLVVEKPTQLFGIRGDRDTLWYFANLTGTQPVPAVVRWIMKEGGGERVLGEIEVGRLPLFGACGSATPWQHPFDTAQGLAIRHFLPKLAGDYDIRMELAQKGGPHVAGSEVTVSGKARKVPNVHIHFVSAFLNASGTATVGPTLAGMNRLVGETRSLMPDYYPLKPGAVTTTANPFLLDLRERAQSAARECNHFPNATSFKWCFEEAQRAEVERFVAMGAWRWSGEQAAPDRFAVVTSPEDMNWLYPSRSGSIRGFASATKVFYVRSDVPQFTVAHEFAHTTPQYAWLHPNTDCNTDYHNKVGNWGHGFRLTNGGTLTRQFMGPGDGLMSNGRGDTWIEQCTYEHLLRNLDKLQDPTLIGVHLWLAKNATYEGAIFRPGLTFEGNPDLLPGGVGRFALVLRDAAGDELATYRFDHPFEDDWGGARHLASVSLAVERPPGVATLEARGPSGLLARLPVTPNAPTLSVPPFVTPDPVADLPVTWTASDPDGDELEFTVSFSPDGGNAWYFVVNDPAVAAATVPAGYFLNATAPIVRVTASDGVNSFTVDRVASSSDPAAPTTPPSPPPTSATSPPAPTPTTKEKGTPGIGFAAAAAVGTIVAAFARRRRA